jgi:undecaprenyl-diphosphatase
MRVAGLRACSAHTQCRLARIRVRLLSLAIALLASSTAVAGLDHRLTYDNSGIWARHYQEALEYGVIAVGVGGALWLGADDKLGKTFWQTIDASVAGALTVTAGKYIFGRERPSQTDDPHQWFKGSCCQSFPSGEITLQQSFVTPFIVNYAGENPWVWGLEALPIYDAIARMKTWGHWQTDAIASIAIGATWGYLATKRETPFFVEVLPKGISVGIHTRF